MPTRWYNILHDLPTPPPPPLHPGTGQPVGPDDLAAIFPMDLIAQEVTTEQYVDIPQEVQDVYRLWRPSPLYRAHRLEKALGTPARIYYKYEGVSPAGSHKPNTAVPQAYYNAQGRHPEADDRDRRRPVGHRAGVRLRPVRPGVRGLAGAGLLRRQALPQDHDGDLRRHGAPEPVRPHRGRTHDARQRPRLPRFARPGHQRGRRDGRPGPHRQLRAGLGAQPRAAAPDDHRRGGPAPAGQDRRERRPHRGVHRRWLELRRPDLPVPAREARLRHGPGHPGGRAGVVPVTHPGHLRLRLR